MKFHVQFQHLPHGSDRPLDNVSHSDFSVDEHEFGLLPNVGDFVQILAPGRGTDAPTFVGRVRSRLFTFFNDENCGINIVVEATDHDLGVLVKQ